MTSMSATFPRRYNSRRRRSARWRSGSRPHWWATRRGPARSSPGCPALSGSPCPSPGESSTRFSFTPTGFFWEEGALGGPKRTAKGLYCWLLKCFTSRILLFSSTGCFFQLVAKNCELENYLKSQTRKIQKPLIKVLILRNLRGYKVKQTSFRCESFSLTVMFMRMTSWAVATYKKTPVSATCKLEIKKCAGGSTIIPVKEILSAWEPPRGKCGWRQFDTLQILAYCRLYF